MINQVLLESIITGESHILPTHLRLTLKLVSRIFTIIHSHKHSLFALSLQHPFHNPCLPHNCDLHSLSPLPWHDAFSPFIAYHPLSAVPVPDSAVTGDTLPYRLCAPVAGPLPVGWSLFTGLSGVTARQSRRHDRKGWLAVRLRGSHRNGICHTGGDSFEVC